MKNKKNPLIEALRDELRKLIDGDLTVSSLAQISNISAQAQELLITLTPPSAAQAQKMIRRKNGLQPFGLQPINVTDYQGEGVALAPSPLGETFGARGMREIMESVSSYLRAQQETPEKLVAALAAARSAKLDNVADALEEKLLGKLTPPKTNGKHAEKS